MKKLVSFLSILSLFASMFTFYPQADRAVFAANRQNDAIFAAVKWVPVGFTRSGETLSNTRKFPWQRGNEELWGNRQYPMPTRTAPRPATSSSEAKPLFYSEVYFDVLASGGQSTESNHYYIVLDDQRQIWFDKDGRFQDARESLENSSNCYSGTSRVDPGSGNNTMGPYAIGEYLHIDNKKGFLFTISGALNPLQTTSLDYSGRVFHIGNALLGNENNQPVLLLAEVLQASCSGTSYNISIESDLWTGTNPAVTSARLLSSSEDVPEVAQLIQKSTVLDPSGREFFAPATTFHNIRLKHREYIGVEIWKDNGVNVNEYGGTTRSNNLSDDYQAGTTCEEFLGLQQGISDTDSYLPLSPLPVNSKFYSSTGSPYYGCGGSVYNDEDANDLVSEGDTRVFPIRLTVGEIIIDYPAGTVVAAGDSDVNLPLQAFVREAFYDVNETNIFDYGDFIYRDMDVDLRVSSGDLRLTDIRYRGTDYSCGSTVRVGDTWLFENPVTGISIGKNGNFRYMDMEVLPGQQDLDIQMTPSLKVEQTSTIDIRINPSLQSGEKAFILIRSIDGGESIREISANSSVYTFTYTPWEGTCSPLGKNLPIIFELYRSFQVSESKLGPKDGDYGYWKVDTPRMVSFLEDQYDCRMYRAESVEPEGISFRTNIPCLSNISSRFPNLVLKMTDPDNKSDINDPKDIVISSTSSRNILANYNATGSGVEYMFTANDKMNNTYIIQVNRDNTYLLWKWVDNPSPTPGKGFYGALDFEDQVTGPYDSVNGQALYGGSLVDKDCSEKDIECRTCQVSGLPPLGKITKGDTWGIFDGVFGEILNDGVWVFVTSYGNGLIGKDGGEFPLCLWPREENNDMSVRVFTTQAQYDYNSMISHPPYFIQGGGEGIDYCGIALLGWKNTNPTPPTPPDPDPPPNPDPPGGGRNDGISFSEFVVVDHSLQYSEFSYSNSIHPDYDPTLQHMIRDFRSYPGGQTHTGRAGQMMREGRNACPANWEDQFVKLGTEFFPMTDYGIYFVLRDSSDGGILSFESGDRSHKITQIEITGPFVTPYFPLSRVRYGDVSNVPLTYDWDGEVIIDSSNYADYELTGADWTTTTNPGMRDSVHYAQANSVLEYSRRLNYKGISKVIVVDELIPVQYGKISIRVHLADGRVGDYFDCCDVPMEGIPVHALDIGDYTGGIEYGKDCEFSTTILEHESIQKVKQVNDAVVFIWQDRGVANRYNQDILEGAGDGWVTMAPESSENSGYSTAYSTMDDLNEDGKISFNDYETEIIGSYSLATNTWSGGMIDARTFQRNQGKYQFALSEANRCIIDTVGMDFNENGLIDDSEILPVNITAYKYGDDNNSRGYGPMYTNPMNHKSYSHAVYLSGQNIAPVGYSSGPQKSFVIQMTPDILTAGVSPESMFKGQPLTIQVNKENGSPVDLTENGTLSETEVAALFFDDIPLNLPDYYWVRTDLQNASSDQANNTSLFGKKIIEYDFSGAKKGTYIFKNFVANDQGSFRLRVGNKSRHDYGVMDVRIKLPQVEYQVSPPAPEGLVPGTLYTVKAIVKDAMGNLMQGKNVQYIPYSFSTAKIDYMPSYGGYLSTLNRQWVSFDTLYDMTIDMDRREKNQKDWFHPGSIYNQSYQEKIYFADANQDTRLDYQDSLGDVNGIMEFLIPACGDHSYGGLIGCNTLLTQPNLSDVAGKQPEDHGGSLSRRYKPDGVFYLDWFAHSAELIQGKELALSFTDENRKPLPTILLNIENPDLVSGKKNSFLVSIKESGEALIGFQFYEKNEKTLFVSIKDRTKPTLVTLEPKTSGESAVHMKAVYQFEGMTSSFEQACGSFDVVAGISITIVEGEYLYTNRESKVILKIDQPYGDYLKDIKLGLVGSGVEEWEPIESDGTAFFSFTPSKAGTIQVQMQGAHTLINQPTITVYDSTIAPFLTIEEYPTLTRESTVTIRGETQIGCSVYVDTVEIPVSKEGLFTTNIALKEGKNQITFRAFSPNGLKTEKIVEIWKRTSGPEITLDPIPEVLHSITEIAIKGSVSPPDAQVFVNQIKASVTKEGLFSVVIPLQLGENKVHIKGIDSLGNTSEKEITLTLKNLIVIVLTIGKKLMMIDGKAKEMDVAPFIRNGRTMVPIRAIAESFGATVNWKASTETVEIELDGQFISMQIGNSVAMVGKKVTSLDSPPLIENGRTFIPLRFIAESFGAEVEWIPESRTIVIQYAKH